MKTLRDFQESNEPLEFYLAGYFGLIDKELFYYMLHNLEKTYDDHNTYQFEYVDLTEYSKQMRYTIVKYERILKDCQYRYLGVLPQLTEIIID